MHFSFFPYNLNASSHATTEQNKIPKSTTWSYQGEYALKTTESGYLTSRQIESARKTIVRFMKKTGKLWIRVFPDKPYTTHAAEAPMGGGKGSVDMYRAPVKPGRILFEISGIAPEVAREAFSLAAYKLPVKTKLIMSKNEM